MTSDTVRALLALSGKRQNDLAQHFGMSKQTMSNKMARNSWSASDLLKAADLCNSKLVFIMPNGQELTIEEGEAQD